MLKSFRIIIISNDEKICILPVTSYHHNGFVVTHALEHVIYNRPSCAKVHDIKPLW